MSAVALAALRAMLATQNAHVAQHDAKLENQEKLEAAKAAEKQEKAEARKARKAAKKSAPSGTETVSVASGTPVDSAPSGTAPIKGSTGADASGFSVWRGIRATGPGFVAGVAGNDHELRKMRDGIIALANSAVIESDEHDREAAAAFRCARKAEAAGDLEDAAGYDDDGILERGMAQVKLELAETIMSELDSSDDEALVARYRAAGSEALSTETVIGFSNGSFPGASLDANGMPVFEKVGETVAPLTLDPSEADKRRERCRAALAAAQAKNSAPVEVAAAPLVDVSAADREAAIAKLMAESAEDDTTEIAEYLE